MGKKTMLRKLFRGMGLIIIKLLFSILFLTGCLQVNPDFENQIWINNSTSDTLIVQTKKKYIDDDFFYEYLLFPGENLIGHHSKLSIEGLIREMFGRYRGDTVEIYRNDVLEIKWAGPVRKMPDSVNHIFNINSWVIEMGGRKNKMEIATFTISESDFVKHDE
jgi:hypothetical protein